MPCRERRDARRERLSHRSASSLSLSIRKNATFTRPVVVGRESVELHAVAEIPDVDRKPIRRERRGAAARDRTSATPAARPRVAASRILNSSGAHAPGRQDQALGLVAAARGAHLDRPGRARRPNPRRARRNASGRRCRRPHRGAHGSLPRETRRRLRCSYNATIIAARRKRRETAAGSPRHRASRASRRCSCALRRLPLTTSLSGVPIISPPVICSSRSPGLAFELPPQLVRAPQQRHVGGMLEVGEPDHARAAVARS